MSRTLDFGAHMRALAMLLAVIATASSTSTYAAQIADSDLKQLRVDAENQGFARVLVNLSEASLKQIQADPSQVDRESRARSDALIAELGTNVMHGGRWSNGMGQIGLHVTPAAIEQLTTTSLAKSFMPDPTWASRVQPRDDDGSIAAVFARLRSAHQVEVEIELNLPAAYDLLADGSTSVRMTPQLPAAAVEALSKLQARQGKLRLQLLGDAATGAPQSTKIQANLDLDSFVALLYNDQVRTVRPKGFADARTLQWSADVLKQALSAGDAEVIVQLKGGDRFSPKGGNHSDESWSIQRAANKRAFDDILSLPGAGEFATSRFDELGILHTRLSYKALSNLFARKDPRILSLTLNRPAAAAQLVNSAPLINMPQAWAAGYRGAGQNIIVVDTGIRKDHTAFTAGGANRVTFEACFGTRFSSPGTNENYYSICPAASSLGDSPVGYAGAGMPWSDTATCSALAAQQNIFAHDCGHGTHVAGTVAGRASALVTPANLQGVAPDASLVAVQVFSYDKSNLKATTFSADLLAALNAVYSATSSGTANPYVVSMSIGGATLYSSDCPSAYPEFTTAVQNLISRGVPVVVAAGNGGGRPGIAFPACVPQVIKVASVANDSAGTILAGFSNIGAQSAFTGPILLAPGGNSTTSVTAPYFTSTIATKAMKGTSQATPHVSGLYAAIKAAVPGISVADATAWIVSTASFGVTYTFAAPMGVQTYRRIRLPNL